jgi:hypothetical protein
MLRFPAVVAMETPITPMGEGGRRGWRRFEVTAPHISK